MSFINKNLLIGERIVFQTKLHWVVFVGPIVLILIGLTEALALTRDQDSYFFVFWWLIGGLGMISPLVRCLTSEFAVTNRRILIKTGWINRNSLELLLTKVESIRVHQGLFGRVLGYGTITIGGTGATKETFKDIDSSLEFRRRAQEQIEGSHGEASGRN